MPDDEIRFGLIGYGLWGRYHARAIQATPGARLTAIGVPSKASREAAARDCPEVAVLEDDRQLLDRDDVDVVSVVVPNHLHFDIGRAVLASGRHLLLEKPMTLDVGDSDRLLRLAAEQGKVLAVNHEMRLSSLWGRVKSLIDRGIVGAPQYVLIELSRFPYRQGSDGWRYDIQRVGNWILEEPIHFFDLARWYLNAQGEPDSVYARANSRDADHPELKDNFSATLGFPHGAYAVVTQTLAAFGHHVSCKVAGTGGAIWANWSAADARLPDPVFSLRYTDGDPDRIVDVPFEKSTGEVVELHQQIAAVVAAIREGTPPPASGGDGRWAVAMCQAAERSVDLGQPVCLNGS